MKIEAYLFFNGRCEEAVKFYERTLGAEVQMLMRNRESPEPAPPGMLPPGGEDKVMHASLKVGDSVLMASDGYCSGVTEFKGFALSITAADAAAAERMFNALGADGGRVDMPLAKTFWAELFGMVTDRFGVQWMVGLDH